MPRSADIEDSSFGELVAGLKIQFRCLYALLIREMMMRYGRDNLGFLWMILEPMLLCVGVMITWSMLRSSKEHGITLLVLILTGYMPLTMWRHLTSYSIIPFKRSMGVLYHRHISLLDVFLSRMFLEFLGSTTAFVIVAGTLVVTGMIDPPHDVGLVIAGWCLMGLFGFGVASVIAIVTERFELSERFVPVFQYLQLPVSGVFFLVDWLPSYAQDLIWYNPSVHCYEMIRGGYIGPSLTVYYAAWYPAVWGIALFMFGLYFIESMRDHLHG